MLQQSAMRKNETMSTMQHKKGGHRNSSVDLSKGAPTVQVSTALASRTEPATDGITFVPRTMLREVDGKEDEEQKGGVDGSKIMMTPMTKESTVLLAQFSLTRAEIGSFRQLKTNTREKDYCACLFEQQQQQEENVIKPAPLETTVMFGSVETTLLQPIPRLSRSACTTTTAALPVLAAMTTTSCLSYMDPSLPQASTLNTTSSPPSFSPNLPHHHRRRSSPFGASEEKQQHQPRRPITAWLCLACGGPALELQQRWIKRISYTTSTRLLRISVCDSAFSSYEGMSWKSSYKSALRCEDPTNGELSRVRTIDLCLSRLVEPKMVYDLLSQFPSELVEPSLRPSSSLPSSLSHQHLLNHPNAWEVPVSSPPSTDCSPKMSPLGMLSPSLSEDTAWLSSSGGGTPDHFSRPYHQHPQQQVLTDAATDLMMRQQQQQQQFNPRDDDAPDDDPKDSRDCLGRVGDGDLCVKGDFGNTDSSASIMSMLMMNHPRPLLSSPVTEKHQNPNYNHSDQQLSQQNQQHFTQRSLGSHSSSLGQDNAYNTLIRGIETCRGRAVNSHHLHQRSESDSGDLTVFAQSGILPFGIETQPSEQQIYPAAEGKNLQGCRQYNKQKSQCRQPQQYQLQENGGNGGPGQRRKNQRRFSTSRQNNNFHHNLQQFQQYQEHPIGAAVSTIQEQCNRTAPSKIAQQSSVSQASAVAAIVNAKQTLFQAPFRRRCISSGGLDPEPIAPIVPPSVCSALRRRHARRMSCDGRLETYLTSLLVPQPPNSVSPGAVAATVKVPVSSQSNSHRFQQQNHQFSQQCQSSMQSLGNDTRVQSRGRGRTQASINDAQYRSKRNSLTISTDFPKDSLRDTSMSSVSDAGSDRRASISSSISDISISLSHSTTLSSSSSSTCLSSSSSNNGACMRKGGPPVHYTLMCWIGGRWPCRLRPLIKKSTLNDIHAMLRRNLKLPPNYFIDIEFEWQGQTYMIMDATHWQWAREQVRDGDMAIRCKIWQKRFTR